MAHLLTYFRLQKKIGVLPKDVSNGPFADEWRKVYGDISKDVEEVDIAPALSGAAFAVKDENELVSTFMPANFVFKLMMSREPCEMLRKLASPL